MRAIDILEQAMADPVGIKLTVESAKKSIAKLYNLRAKLKEDDIHTYDNLKIFKISETEIWIVHYSALEKYRDERFAEDDQDLDEEISSLISRRC